MEVNEKNGKKTSRWWIFFPPQSLDSWRFGVLATGPCVVPFLIFASTIPVQSFKGMLCVRGTSIGIGHGSRAKRSEVGEVHQLTFLFFVSRFLFHVFWFYVRRYNTIDSTGRGFVVCEWCVAGGITHK